VRSADGTNVYVLPESPVLMLSDNGQMLRAKLTAPPEDPFRPDDLKAGNITVPVVDTPAVAPAPNAVPAAQPTQPLAGQSALDAATQPPAGGSISNEAKQRRESGGVKIYPAGSNNTLNTGGGL
jgi:hypothetical protein